MAKLSAHGQEIGRIAYTTCTKAFFMDGKILRNYGAGWKLHAKLKEGVDPVAHFQKAKVNAEAWLAARPSYAAYKKELHSLAGQCNRAKLHMAVELMPDDCDGVWSEACDGYGDNISAGIDEISELCRLYGAAMIEQKAMKGEAVTA